MRVAPGRWCGNEHARAERSNETFEPVTKCARKCGIAFLRPRSGQSVLALPSAAASSRIYESEFRPESLQYEMNPGLGAVESPRDAVTQSRRGRSRRARFSGGARLRPWNAR